MIDFSAFREEVTFIKEAAFMRDVALPWAKTQALPWAKTQGTGVAKNVAGSLKAFAHPVQNTIEGAKHTVQGLKGGGGVGNVLNAAALVGGTALTAPLYLGKNDPMNTGDSRFVRSARFAGSQIGGLIGAKHGITGGIAAGIAGEAAGRIAGKGIEKATGTAKKLKKTKKEPEKPSALQPRAGQARVVNMVTP